LAHSHSAVPTPRNRLLAAMPPDAVAQFEPKLEPVEFAVRHELLDRDEPIKAVYFPKTSKTPAGDTAVVAPGLRLSGRSHSPYSATADGYL